MIFISFLLHFSASNASVWLGIHDLVAKGPNLVIYKSTDFIVHPSYSSKTYENDIALIRLSPPVKETSAIKIVKLAVGPNTYEGAMGK